MSSSASTVSIEIIPSSVVSTSFSYSDEHDSISIRSETTVGVDGRVSDGRVSRDTFSLIETLVDVDGDGDGIDEVDIDDVDCKLLVGMERGCV